VKDDTLEPKPRSAKHIAVENAANDFLRGDDVVEPCPECGEILEVKVIRPDVLVRCKNGHIDAHRRIAADPGGAMRWGFLIAAGIIVVLALLRRFYFAGIEDPHATQYFDNDRPWVTNIPTPAVPDRRD
jgi:hypothetical protein